MFSTNSKACSVKRCNDVCSNANRMTFLVQNSGEVNSEQGACICKLKFISIVKAKMVV